MSDHPTVTRLPGTEYARPVVQQLRERVIEPAVTRDGYGREHCQHRHVGVESDRRLFCSDCEAHIDPIDYVLGLAQWWDTHVTAMRHIALEERLARQRVAALQRQEKNAKARVRRVEPATLKEARLALKEAGEAISQFIFIEVPNLPITRDDSRLSRLRKAGERATVSAIRLNPDLRGGTREPTFFEQGAVR